MSTGDKSPNPPARAVLHPMCFLVAIDESRATAAAVPFAGLSAGLVGVYQIDVTIPLEWRATRSAITCRPDDFRPGDFAEIPSAR